MFETISMDFPAESSVKDYFALTKPGVLSLVVFSSIAGMILAPGTIHYIVAITSILAVSLGSAAAAAINMWYDRDIDSIMHRTRNRPIVTGKISHENALAFGLVIGFLSILIMAVCVNYLAAFLLLSSISFYVFIYTMWLKRSTPQNIVIGGASGALPPVIGWVSVTGSIDIAPIIMFLIIFFWTPPHFWALALSKNEDYKLAKIPMMPITHGYHKTKTQMLIYAILTVLSSLVLCIFYPVSIFYFISATVLGSKFILDAYRLLKDPDSINSMQLFKFSILYLFELFGALIMDYYFFSIL